MIAMSLYNNEYFKNINLKLIIHFEEKLYPENEFILLLI